MIFPFARGIRARTLAIALMPALLVALLLIVLFTRQSLLDAENQLSLRARQAANHLAVAAEYGLGAGRWLVLERLAAQHRAQSGARYVGIHDARGSLIVSSGTAPAQGEQGLTVESAPVLIEPTDLPNDPFAQALDVEQGALRLGHVRVAFDDAPLRAAHDRLRLQGALTVLTSLLLITVLAWRASHSLSGQITALSRAVERFRGGILGERIPLRGSDDELDRLADGFNRMARTIRQDQEQLERRIAEATASLAREMESAERANRSKSRFLAAASHDLRQPIHALGLFVAALRERARDADILDLVEHIEAASHAVDALLNALLDISRLEAGVIESHIEDFPVARLFHALRRQFTLAARERGIELVFVDSRLALHSDPLLLERILTNLVANALRYTERGRVLVGCRRYGREVRIEVWDTGHGIPESQREAVFEEFVQLRNPERDRDKGLGLGLAIVARLARLLGHELELRSSVGHGSVFAIRVPRATQPWRAPPKAAPVIPTDPLHGVRVVLIDDEPEILEGTARLFAGWGVECIPADSAERAVARMESLRHAPDAVISDYRLRAGENGLEAVARLRARFGAHLPALLITGDTAPETLRHIANSGVPYLTKPLRPAKLRALLSQALREGGGAEAPKAG